MSLLVSVVIPTHNRAHVLGGAIRSALAQKDVSCELIVVDDASTDGTAKLLVSLDTGQMVVVRQTTNVGGAVSRNAGLAVARGRYVAFLDSDDRWLPGALVRALRTMQAKRAGLLIGSFVTRIRRRLVKVSPGASVDGSFRALLRLRAGPFTTSCFLLDRARVPDATFAAELPALQDLDFALGVAAAGHRVVGTRAVHAEKVRMAERTYSDANALAARIQLLHRWRDALDADPVAWDAHRWAILATLVRQQDHDGLQARLTVDDALPRRAGRLLKGAYALDPAVGNAVVTVNHGLTSRPPLRRLRDRLDQLMVDT